MRHAYPAVFDDKFGKDFHFYYKHLHDVVYNVIKKYCKRLNKVACIIYSYVHSSLLFGELNLLSLFT